jgi:hypothetical protein
MPNLSETRKADRAKMTAAILALAAKLGITADVGMREGESTLAPRMTMIHLEDAKGLCITVDFDGQSPQPNTYLLSWHIASNSMETLSDAFAGSSAVNPHHRLKATQVAYDFEWLCILLEAGYAKSADGSAYRK